MAERTIRSTSDFETQLQLGEKLLNLGRVSEALDELRKASALNDVGRYSSPDNSAERVESLQRLDEALSRAESLNQTKTETSNRWWIASLALALLLFGIFFAGWVLNRASMLDMEIIGTQEAEVNAAQEKELTNHIDALHAEGTRLARTNGALQREIVSLQENNQQIAQAANNNLSEAYVPLQTVAAENAKAVQNMAAIAAQRPISSGGAEIIVITQTVSGPGPAAAVVVPQIDVVAASNKMRITTNKTNFRYGPGLNYGIQGGLNAGDFVDALARSDDNYWYYVETAQDQFGWIHVSLAIPVDFDWLPEKQSEFAPLPTITPPAASQPAQPVPPPTAVTEDQAVAPAPAPSTNEDQVVASTSPTSVPQNPVVVPPPVVIATEEVQQPAVAEAQPTAQPTAPPPPPPTTAIVTPPVVIPTIQSSTIDIAPTPTPEPEEASGQ
ncbi:MAG: SH3 domain-containing protein [Candidatus Promineifilaceae bacterium]